MTINKQYIEKIFELEFREKPSKILRQGIGICNEVFEVKTSKGNFFLRINEDDKYIYGTHKFLPIHQKLNIKTPVIIAEDYSKKIFPFCYQILSKIEGQDLGIVIADLNEEELQDIAEEICNIFEKFNTLPTQKTFGWMRGTDEENIPNLFDMILFQKKTILERNEKTKIIDQEILDILDDIISKYQNYFKNKKPKIYYDDICSKNVMIHNGKFNGIVDLDCLVKGDYLEAIGRIIASWHGEDYGEIYINEIIKNLKLNTEQQEIIKVYAIIALIYWMSEEGIKFNANTSTEINRDKIEENKNKVLKICKELNKSKDALIVNLLIFILLVLIYIFVLVHPWNEGKNISLDENKATIQSENTIDKNSIYRKYRHDPIWRQKRHDEQMRKYQNYNQYPNIINNFNTPQPNIPTPGINNFQR